MRVLVDTQALLWSLTDDPRLSKRAKEIFTRGRNELLISVASIWEVLTKVQIGKLPLPRPAGAYLTGQLKANRIEVLLLRLDHVLRLEELRLHHRDPFDRILVAQALVEEIPILTADPLLKRYPASLLW
ncbi:MAG: type II toxin-antitoxin system VapC family toxin [Candidatus Sulfotelmatobacter sp.]